MSIRTQNIDNDNTVYYTCSTWRSTDGDDEFIETRVLGLSAAHEWFMSELLLDWENNDPFVVDTELYRSNEDEDKYIVGYINDDDDDGRNYPVWIGQEVRL